MRSSSCSWIITASRVLTGCYWTSLKHCVFSLSREKCPMRKGPVKAGGLPQWRWQISLWMRLCGKQCPKSWSMWEAPMTRVSVPEGRGSGLRGALHGLASSVENTRERPQATCHYLFQWRVNLLRCLRKEAAGDHTDFSPAHPSLCSIPTWYHWVCTFLSDMGFFCWWWGGGCVFF